MANDPETGGSARVPGGAMSLSTEVAAGPDAASASSVVQGAGDRPARRWFKRRQRRAEESEQSTGTTRTIDVVIDPDDPLLAVLRASNAPLEIDDLPAFSPAVRRMRADGVVLVVPLVASGQLVGVLALGERLSERGYSRDDRALLASLARHAAPALRLGQMVRQQEQEARHLQRIESELAVAQLIQQHFLPSQLPAMHGWQVDAFYRPARTVGGDFYDVIALADGRIMVVAGDVTDKGVPAALVMASTQALLRAAAVPGATPGTVLRTVNDLLHAQIPTHMFVTCLVLVFDPATGATVFANAGHNLPYLRHDGTVTQLMARGMPLGLMPGSEYEEQQAVVQPGDILVVYSDGITEQHDSSGEMFDFARTEAAVAGATTGAQVVDGCVAALAAFSAGCEQEDDITLVAITRPPDSDAAEVRFAVPSIAGTEREVRDRVLAVVGEALPPDRRDAFGTAVAETAMNAIEHGNDDRPDLDVEVVVAVTAESVTAAITDRGGGRGDAPAQTPDLDLKLAGLQSTRGWGLFLIEALVDRVAEETGPEGRHTMTLTMLRTEGTP